MKVLSVAVLALLFSVSTFAQASSQSADLTLKDIHGRQLRLSDDKGKVVLINFWATWCIPCRTEIPDLVKLQSKYRSQGLRIIGITYPPETLSEVRIFVRKLRINYPVAIGTKETKALFTTSETLPMTVVIDSQGTIQNIIEGVMYADEFEETVKPLLSQGSPALKSSPRKNPAAVVPQRVMILVDGHRYRRSLDSFELIRYVYDAHFLPDTYP